MKLATDHHFSPLVAQWLRERGHDAVSAEERRWNSRPDEELLADCYDERRALLTKDIGDFALIARTWFDDGRSHAGLLLAPTSRMSTRRNNIGRVGEVLGAFMKAHPSDDALVDRIVWL